MFESPISKKNVFLAIVFSLFVSLIIFFNDYFNQHTKIIFCNVGQGDAAYIRIKNKIDVLIDAGPDKSVLSCLGKHMPFWDRKIELAFLSHPNSDHYNGYFYIAERYKIDNFITVDSPIISKTYKKLLEIISRKKITLVFKYTGDKIPLGKGDSRIDPTILFLWPPKDFNSSNDNDFSQVFLFQENSFRTLFTGDASPFVFGRLSHGAINKVDVLKIPHHGSKNGLTKKFLDLADPRIAVINVGKNNSYGHPSKEVLDMLKAKNINIKRTDEDGSIIFNLKE